MDSAISSFGFKRCAYGETKAVVCDVDHPDADDGSSNHPPTSVQSSFNS